MDNENTKDNKSSQKRLLIIDDEKNMRHMLSALLKESGYRVDTASDGAVAMDMVDRTIYDFILCDLKMPNMNGMDFFKTRAFSKALTAEAKSPIVAYVLPIRSQSTGSSGFSFASIWNSSIAL